jgi:nucleoside-diphosphate-sugar epimerase
MDRVLITGGTGFVGHWLRVCKPEGVNIYSMGRKKYDEMEWSRQKWDAIIHLAPTPPTDVLACAKRNKARVLYASSGIIYHPENEARRKYREFKVTSEQECLDSGVDVVIARLFTFCGDRLDDNKAISTFTKAAQDNKTLVISGDGSTVRSYMNGKDMAVWMWAILKHGEKRRAYDVGSDEAVNMFELAKQIIRVNNSNSDILVKMGVDPMPYYLPEDTGKTRALLSLQEIEINGNITAIE